MDHPSLYDDDIVTWAEQQAAALRGLARRPDLSNVLDWENVAEEIESVGRSQIRAVDSLLEQMLAHLLKRVSAPDAPTAVHWRKEIATFQLAGRSRYERSMRQRLDMDKIWSAAKHHAALALSLYDDTLLSNLPEQCPFTSDELLEITFDVDAALSRIAERTLPRSMGHS